MTALRSCTNADFLQPPKTPINAQRQAAILAWFHKTALAYSIKDLEKLIPSVTAVNSMGVKEYIQAMQDDGLICSEKIGNGNWYWSFPSEAKKKKEKALADAQEEYDTAVSTTTELQAKVDQAGAARAEDAELLAETGTWHEACGPLNIDTSRWRS